MWTNYQSQASVSLQNVNMACIFNELMKDYPSEHVTCDVMIGPRGGWSPLLRYCWLSITISRLARGHIDRTINRARLLKMNITRDL